MRSHSSLPSESVIFNNYNILKVSMTLPLKLKLVYQLLEDIYLESTSQTLSKDQAKKYKPIVSAFKRQSQ